MAGSESNWFALEPAPQRGWRTGEANTLSLVHAWEPPAPVGLGQDDSEFDPFADSGVGPQPDPSPPTDQQQRPWWQPQLPDLDPLQAINALGSNIQSTLQQWAPPAQQAPPQTVQPETFPDTQIGPQTEGANPMWSKPRQPTALERSDIADQGGSLPDQTPEYNFPTKIEPAGTSQYPPQGNIMELFGKAAENVTQAGLAVAPQGLRDFLRQPLRTPFQQQLPFSPADVSSFAADPSNEFLNAAPLVAAVAGPVGKALGPVVSAILKKIVPSNELMPLVVPANRELYGMIGNVLTNRKLLDLGVPITTGLIGGVAAGAQADDPSLTPWERAATDILHGVGGFAVAGTVGAIGNAGLIRPTANIGSYLKGLQKGVDLEAHRFPSTIEAEFSPGLKESMNRLNEGAKVDAGFVLEGMPKPYYPGGWHGLLWDQYIRAPWSDHWAVLQSWQKSIEQRTGILPDTERSYDLTRNLAGIQGVVEKWTTEHITPILNGIGVTNPETRGHYSTLQMYWEINRRAQMKEMGTGTVRPVEPGFQQKAADEFAEVAAAVNKLYSRNGENVAAKWARSFFDMTDQYNGLLDRMEQSGILHAGEAAVIKEKHPTYMYIRQVEKKLSDLGVMVGANKTAVSNKDLIQLEHTGGERIVANVESTVGHMWDVLTALGKQEVGQSLIANAEKDPEGFGRIFIRAKAPEPGIPSAPKGPKALYGQTVEAIGEHPALPAPEGAVPQTVQAGGPLATVEPPTPALPPPFEGAVRGAKGWEWHGGDTVPTGWDVVKIFENGEPTSFLTPKWMQSSLLGLQPKHVDLMTKLMTPLSYPYRLGATVFNPAFALAYNPSRDLQQAYQNIGFGSPLMKGFFSNLWNLMNSEEFAPALSRRTPYVVTGAIGGFSAAQPPPDETNPAWRMTNKLEGAGIGALMGLGGKITFEQLAQHTNLFSTLERRNAESNAHLQEMLRGGIRSGTTYAESVRSEKSKAVGKLLDVEPSFEEKLKQGNLLGAVSEVISSPFNLMKTAAEIMELATRGSVYHVARTSEERGGMGLSEQASKLLSRESTVDFHKGGDAARLFGLWFPFLNPRIQGTLRSAKALQEHPEEYLARSTLLGVLPVLLTQAWNRTHFSDEYDKIPQRDRDNYFPIVVGTYQDSLLGDTKPIYVKIATNDITAIPAVIARDAFDLLFHTKNHGIDLGDGQRVERNWGRAFAQRFLNMSPISMEPEDFHSPGEFLRGLASEPQAPGGLLQLAINYNHFTGSDLVPESPNARSTRLSPNLLAKFSGDTSKALFNKEMRPAPEQVEFFAQRGFAGLGQEFLGAIDQLSDALGVQPPLPPGMPQRTDNRPRWAAMTSALGLTGTSGGAQTVAEKLRNMPEEDQNIWAQTQAVNREYATMRQDARAKINQIYQRADANGARIMSDVNDVQKALKDEQQKLYAAHPLAIKTTEDRAAFSARIPGVPLAAGLFSDSADLPDGIDLQAISQRYYNPPGTTPQQMAMLPPDQVAQLRNLELQRIARETGVKPEVLLDNMKFNDGGKLPSLGVPDNFIEEAVNRWINPSSPEKYTTKDSATGEQYVDAAKLRNARAAELGIMSKESGIPIDQLEERIKARIQADPMTPQEKTAMGAFRFSDTIHDPAKFAPYMTADFKPLSGYGPKDWANWDIILEQAAAKGIVNTQVLALKKAKAYGNAAKVKFMQDPHNYNDYKDYERWFGVGRSMSATDWANYQTGKYPRYTDAGSTPLQWDQRDLVQRMWRTLPDGDYRKGNLAPIAARYRAMMAKDWKAKMDFDTFQAKVVQGDYDSLDRALQLQR